MKYSSDSLTYSIQAAVLRTKVGPLQIENLEIERQREDEVLLRIVSSGICHTDIDVLNSWDESMGPCVLGHEGAGIVEKVGDRVEGFVTGDHVVLSYQSCGFCSQCRSGRQAACEHFLQLNFGFERLDGSNALLPNGVRGHFFGQSSFATHVVTTTRNMVKVSKDLDLSLLAPLGCGLQTGAGTVLHSLKVTSDSSIAVFGTGTVGLAAVMAAHLVGADPIIGVDIRPHRLGLAATLGATHNIDNGRQDVMSAVKSITGKGVDFVIETTGNGGMIATALRILNPQGTAALLATAGGSRTFAEGRRSLSIIQGDAVPQQFIPRLIDLHQSGRFPFDRLVRFYDFREINRAIADSVKGTTIKPVLRIREG
jgi:aryl-alcohol dehydrogenase